MDEEQIASNGDEFASDRLDTEIDDMELD